MISFIILLILIGGFFVTSDLFDEGLNTPKEYFILITVTILLISSIASRKGIIRLLESLKSRTMVIGMVTVCMVSSIYGIFQFFGLVMSNHSLFPVTGSFDNPAGFAAAQAALFPFVFTNSFDNENGKKIQTFSLLVSILCLVSVVLSGSRAGFLALCSVIVVVLAFTDSVASFFKDHHWLILPIMVTFLVLLCFLYHFKQDSADGRLFIWKRCFEMIKEHPFFGYGSHGFHRCYMSTQANFFQNNPESPFIMLADNVTHPFNEYIKLTINYGLVGLSIALGFLIWLVIRLLKSEKHTKILGLSFVTSLFVMCQFSYPFRYAIVWLLLLIAVVPAFVNPQKDLAQITKCVRLSVLILLFGFLSFVIKDMYYDMKWAEISKRSIVGQTERMIKYYDNMKTVMKKKPLFLYNYAAELHFSGRHEESLSLISQCTDMWNDYDVQMLLASNYVSLKDKENAIQSLDKACNMIPCRFEPMLGKMNVYLISNDTINIIRIANEINEKPVKVMSERVSFIKDQARQILSYYDE